MLLSSSSEDFLRGGGKFSDSHPSSGRRKAQCKKRGEGVHPPPPTHNFACSLLSSPTMVSHFGAIFFPVAPGTVVVCKNNTRVLVRSGWAGAQQKKSEENPNLQNSDIGIKPRWHSPVHTRRLPPPCPNDYAKQSPHNMMRTYIHNAAV